MNVISVVLQPYIHPHYLICLSMSLKQINVKQAEKWLERLKNQNAQSYKNLVKFLRCYEKTEDQYDCYVKISHTLLAHTELTKDLNTYMEEPNKFVVNKPEDQKIKEFMAYVKRNRPDVFERIIQMIQDLSKSKGENPLEISKNLRPRLKDIVEGDPQLQRITEEALDLTGQELISRKNLQHLKGPKTGTTGIEEEKEVIKQPVSKQAADKQKKAYEAVSQNYARQPGGRFNRPLLVGPFTNPSEEKSLIRQIQKMVDQKLYTYIIKVINLYYLNIITRNEAFDLLEGVQADELYMECLRDIIDTRETQRRKASCFKPLEDINFNNVQRASPSYVAMPPYYPIISSGKTDWIKKLTNQIWVSVPHGSQQSENFSVRNKNLNEINLLKAEDQRYEFDIYMRRLQKTLSLLDQILDQKTIKTQKEKQKIIHTIIQMGTLQLIFRNSHKDQKQEIEWLLKVADIQTCKIFKERVASQINELKNIKQVHAVKNWNQVASKNFFKALDLKGFQFKKNEKDKMKTTFFISELQQRLKLLQNGGQSKNIQTFQQKKDYFTILNSFECSSRTQKCISRKLPQIQIFDLKDERNRHLYPLIILSFEDISVCQHFYSLLLFYIGAFQMGENEKLRCRIFLEQFLINFLGWKLPSKEYLNENFDEQKFYNKINGEEEALDIKEWVSEEKQEILVIAQERDEDNKEKDEKKKFGFLKDHVSSYSYLPAKNQNKTVLYGSEHLYTFTRFIYAAYQRLIKMKQVAETTQKLQLFKILFYSCIKTKEGSKFEENLNLLFGKHSYLFSTLYKLFDNLIKCLMTISNCPIMSYSLKTYSEESEDIYFVLLNRFCLNSGLNNSKIVRMIFNKEDKTTYFNCIDSYYKSEETGKDMVKKRAEIAKGIEIYTNDSFGPAEKKRRKLNQVYQNNELEYIFEGSTIKMMNHRQNEDLLVFSGKRTVNSKLNKRELKRADRVIQKIN